MTDNATRFCAHRAALAAHSAIRALAVQGAGVWLPAAVAAPTGRDRWTGPLLELHGKGIWQDIGALKAWLRDDLVGERNRYARAVVKDMEARKGKAG